MDNLSERSWQQLDREVESCRKCPRLVAWREEVARTKRRAFKDWEYWGKPVIGFGDRQGRVLVVGLAPGAHGANRTGRMFTGDDSGNFLYRALYRAGFANQPTSEHKDDGLALRELYITASARCAPPDNKPSADELANCLPYLRREIQLMPQLEGIVALGKIAFDQVLKLYRQNGTNLLALSFGHGAFYSLGGDSPWLLASYHPSRQNTQTGRLTEDMFDSIWNKVRSLLDEKNPAG